MPSPVRANTVLLVLLAVALAGWLGWTLKESAGSRARTSVTAAEVPVVIRTQGGLLEVAVLQALERFSRVDAREFWGLPLGTTVSRLQVPVYYRYHIELAREWRVVIRGKTCIVQAPTIRPSLPVAFDTAELQKYTENGWARFNKNENLAALERSVTAELTQRANSPAYRELVTAAARQTVSEFIGKWLLKEAGWGSGPEYKIVVLFPGESAAASGAARVAKDD